MSSLEDGTFTTVWIPKTLVIQIRSMGHSGEAVHRTIERLVQMVRLSEKSSAELLRTLLIQLEEGELR